ncbi:hypothetical protein [Methylocystis echinoides]|jgi:hypothetical protein|uniref:hypothetical protein n=1 Tax=Methylocystis echinoides TaxID=29468 RepID=UPI00341AA7AD
MQKILVISAFLSAGAVAPALAVDQGDPNPPTFENGQPVMPKGAQATPEFRQAEAQDAPVQGSGVIPKSTTQPSVGETSGPAVGTHVDPPTVVQKDNPAAQMHASPTGLAGPSGTSAGSPGIEGKAGTQAGKEWLPPEEIRSKKPSS